MNVNGIKILALDFGNFYPAKAERQGRECCAWRWEATPAGVVYIMKNSETGERVKITKAAIMAEAKRNGFGDAVNVYAGEIEHLPARPYLQRD